MRMKFQKIHNLKHIVGPSQPNESNFAFHIYSSVVFYGLKSNVYATIYLASANSHFVVRIPTRSEKTRG